MQLLGSLNGNTVTEPDTWSKEIEKEIIRIEKALLSFVFTDLKEIERKQYIQHHQQRLLYLIKRINHYKHSGRSQTLNATESYTALAEKHVQNLLHHIGVHFEEDMRINIQASSAHQLEVINTLKNKKPLLAKAFDSLGMDKGLSGILTETLDLFIHHSTNQSFNYGQLFMMRDIADLIFKYPDLSIERDGNETKWMVINLCMLNFNHLNFYKFCRNWIVQYYPNGDDRYYRYIRFMKFFERIPVKPGYGWNVNTTRITHMLSDYFKDAALTVKRKQREQLFIHSNSRDQGLNETKLSTTLTVDQLGLFMRLLKDTGILKANTVASLIRFCMQHISTVGKNPAQEISYEYLKSSISKTTPDTLDRVEQHLQNMSGQLRKLRLEARKSAGSNNKK